jgi:hypothetical protein
VVVQTRTKGSPVWPERLRAGDEIEDRVSEIYAGEKAGSSNVTADRSVDERDDDDAGKHRGDRVRPELRAIALPQRDQELFDPVWSLRCEQKRDERHTSTIPLSGKCHRDVPRVHLRVTDSSIENDDDDNGDRKRDENRGKVKHVR